MTFRIGLRSIPYIYCSSANRIAYLTNSQNVPEGDFKSISERLVSKIDYSYLLAPRELRAEDLSKSEISHYFYTREQIEKIFPRVAKAFDLTFPLVNSGSSNLIGSGFLCDDGKILTCSHVANECFASVDGVGVFGKNINIALSGTELTSLDKVELIYFAFPPYHEDQPDLALAFVPELVSKGFIPLSGILPKVGQRIFLMGNPSIFNKQLISIGTVQEVLSAKSNESVEDLVICDTESYRGNSGGPLVDEEGNCFGILQKSYGIDGKGYTEEAICISALVARDLISNPLKYFEQQFPDIELND